MKLFDIRRLVVSIGIGIVACCCCHADVYWSERELKTEAFLGAAAVEFAFGFKNAGSLPMEFDSPSASCGCTLAKLDKIVYAPGESGVLKGTYSTSGRRGLNTVTITVKGNEVDGDVRRPFSDVLKVSVTIPEVVKLTPGIALWRRDSAAVAKTIRFEVNETLSMPLALASIDKKIFTGEWTAIAEGKVYELKVTPVSTTEAGQAMVTVEGIDKDGKILKFYTHLMVR